MHKTVGTKSAAGLHNTNLTQLTALCQKLLNKNWPPIISLIFEGYCEWNILWLMRFFGKNCERKILRVMRQTNFPSITPSAPGLPKQLFRCRNNHSVNLSLFTPACLVFMCCPILEIIGCHSSECINRQGRRLENSYSQNSWHFCHGFQKPIFHQMVFPSFRQNCNSIVSKRKNSYLYCFFFSFFQIVSKRENFFNWFVAKSLNFNSNCCKVWKFLFKYRKL